MGGVSMFTYQFEGHAWQIDMHMYFFAALACIVAYCDYRADRRRDGRGGAASYRVELPAAGGNLSAAAPISAASCCMP